MRTKQEDRSKKKEGRRKQEERSNKKEERKKRDEEGSEKHEARRKKLFYLSSAMVDLLFLVSFIMGRKTMKVQPRVDRLADLEVNR